MLRVTYVEIDIKGMDKGVNNKIHIWRNKRIVIINGTESKRLKTEIDEFFKCVEHNDIIANSEENYFYEDNEDRIAKWQIKIRYDKNKIKKLEGNKPVSIFGNMLIQKFYEVTNYKYNIKGEEYVDFRESLKDVYKENVKNYIGTSFADVVRCYRANKSIERTSKITGYKKNEVKKILKRAKIIVNNEHEYINYEDNGLDIRDFF